MDYIMQEIVSSIVWKNKKQLKRLFLENQNNLQLIIEFIRYHCIDLLFLDLIIDDREFYESNKEFVDNLICEYHKVKTKALLQKQILCNINEKFRSNDIKFIVLKGMALNHSIYKNRVLRKFSDIDFLVDSSDLVEIGKILEKLGYIQGTYNPLDGKIKPFAREILMKKKLYGHEIGQYTKMVNDNFNSNIDINFKFSWTGYKNKYDSLITFKEAYENVEDINIDNYNINILDKYFNLMHLCCHFFNGSVNFLLDEDYILDDDPREICLIRLFDIIEIINQKNIDFNYFYSLVDKYKIQEQVGYVIKLINKLFGYSIPIDNKIAQNSIDDLSEINYYYNTKGEKHNWPISLKDRIFNLEKKKEIIKALKV